MPLLDVSDPGAVCELFRAAAEVGLGAACREGATDVIRPPAVLVATGDIHDNPINLGKLIRLAGMDDTLEQASADEMQLSFFNLDDPLLEEIRDEILHLDIDTLTPVEALMKLNEIKRLLTKKKKASS